MIKDSCFFWFNLVTKLNILYSEINVKKQTIISICLLISGAIISPITLADTLDTNSPASYDYQSKLIGKAGEGVARNGDARTDALFDFAEKIYPQFFSSHETSTDVLGYYARYYPESNMYIGTKNGVLFAYGAQLGGLYNAGGLGGWFSKAGL